MKLIKIIFLILLSIVVLIFLGTFIFLKTLNINQFKDGIVEEISNSIEREVSIKNLSFNFSITNGVSLGVSGFAVSDQPNFSSEALFYVDSARLNIDILPLLLKRQIFISKIEFDSPKINIIKNNIGILNIEPFIESDEDEIPEARDEFKQEPEEADQESDNDKDFEITFGDLLIRSIRINDGTILFIDRSSVPSVTIPITKINIKITNLALNAPFPINADASVWSTRKNIHINGLAHISEQNQQIRIDDLQVKTDFSDLSMDLLYESVPILKAIGLKEKLGGQFVIDVHQMILGESGLLLLSSEGRFSNGTMKFKDVPIPIENLNINFDVSESDIDLKKATLSLASGEVNLSGRIADYTSEQIYTMNLNMDNVQISELLSHLELPVKIEGSLYETFKINGQGFDEQALKTALTGVGTFGIKNGRILDFNMLRDVLRQLSSFPNFVEKIVANLPERYKDTLNQEDTILGKVNIDTQIRDGTLVISRAEINADGFLIVAQGRLDLDQNISMTADLYIERELSGSMIAAAEVLSFLLDERQQIHIPLKPYSGKLDKFIMVPDIGDLSREFIQNRGREELRKVIFRALDLEVAPKPTPSEGQETAPQEQGASPEEILIENILDMIPIFK